MTVKSITFSVPQVLGAVVVVILVMISQTIFASPTKAESWTDLRGTRTIEARMVGMWGDSVVLELQNGNRVSVELNSLRSESRIQAQQLAREWEKSRVVRVKELQGQAVAAAAPAPDPLPMPPATTPYSPPDADQAIGPFLQQIETLVRDGHLKAVFDALPPSYRNDLGDVIKLASEKVTEETWNKSIGALQEFGDAIVTKQRWFLSSPRVVGLPPETFETVTQDVMTLAGAMRVGLAPDVISLQKLRDMPTDQWMTDFDKAIAPFVAQLFQFQSGGNRTVTVDSEKDDTAIVSIEQSGKKSKVNFTKVDGYWVPKSLAEKWTASIESAKKSIAENTTGDLFPVATGFGTIVLSFTGPMSSASTADQYHGAMESVFASAATIETAIAGFGNLIGKNFSMSGRPGSGGYPGSSGYPSGYESDSGMNDPYNGASGGADGMSSYEEQMRSQQSTRP